MPRSLLDQYDPPGGKPTSLLADYRPPPGERKSLLDAAPVAAADSGDTLSQLSGWYRDMAAREGVDPSATPDFFTSEDRSNLNTWGPRAAAAAASLMLPATPVLAGVGGALLGAASRAATPFLEGEGTDAALREASPLTHPWQTALDFAVPFGVNAIGHGAAATPLSDLPDFQQATSLEAPLKRFADTGSLDDIIVAAKDSEPAMDLTLPQTARAAISAPARLLTRSPSPAAQMAGDRLEEYGALQRFLEVKGQHVIDGATAHLATPELDQVTGILKGALPADQVAGHVTQAADTLRTHFYDPLGRLAMRAGVMTKTEDGALQPFQMIGENYAPDIPVTRAAPSAADLLRRGNLMSPSQVAYQRAGSEAPMMTNAREVAQSYLDTMSRKIATSHAFGSPSSAAGGWGKDARQLMEGMIADRKPLEATLWKQTMQRVYSPPAPRPIDQLAKKISGITGKVMLGQSALTQLPQASTNIMRSGVGNWIEGLARHASDPSFRELENVSGGTSAGLANNAIETGVNARSIPAASMRWIEGKLRGVSNAGAIPQIEKLVASAQAARAAGTTPSASIMRQLSELRIPLDDAEGGVTADLLRRAFQRSSDVNQFHSGTLGQSGEIMQGPVGKLATQFQGFGQSAYRNFQDSLAEPILSGLMHAEPSDVGLGVMRAGRWIPAAVGLAGATNLMRDAIRGREPDMTRALSDGADAIVGTPSRALMSALGAMGVVPETPYDPSNALLPPAAAMATEAYKHPIESLLFDVPAAVDPTGVMAAARPSLRGNYTGPRTLKELINGRNVR